MKRILSLCIALLFASFSTVFIPNQATAEPNDCLTDAIIFDHPLYSPEQCQASCSPNNAVTAVGTPSTISGLEGLDQRWVDLANQAGQKYNVDPHILLTILHAEQTAHWPLPFLPNGPYDNPDGSSEAGARGPFQFIRNTWEAYKVDGDNDGVFNRESPYDATYAAANFISRSFKQATNLPVGGNNQPQGFKQNQAETPYTMASLLGRYNQGPGSYKDAQGVWHPNASWQQVIRYIDDGTAFYAQISGQPIEDSGSTPGATSCAGSVSSNNSYTNTWTGSKIDVKCIVLHWTAGPSTQSVEEFINVMNGRGLSVQYFVAGSGTVYALTPTPDTLAFHAKDANSSCIGMEIAGLGADDLLGNDTQFQAVVGLVTQLMSQFNVPRDGDPSKFTGVTSHHLVDKYVSQPSGKVDVGDEYLAKVKAELPASGGAQ